MIVRTLGIAKGGGKAGREVAGKLSKDQVRQIATDKMPDMNANDVEAAIKLLSGTARSMGIEIEN